MKGAASGTVRVVVDRAIAAMRIANTFLADEGEESRRSRERPMAPSVEFSIGTTP